MQKLVFYITGTSSGIGLALTSHVLTQHHCRVIGYARRCKISKPNYTHIYADLSQPGIASNVDIPFFETAEHIVLINNAGMLGDVKPVGKIDNRVLEQTFILNTIAPAVLMNRILSLYSKTQAKITIVNISSGAARHPVESWAGYCASKAALDMFSLVIQAEQQIKEQQKVTVLSIAPGVVDTPMQDLVRQVPGDTFPQSERFHHYKAQGMLENPEKVAKKIVELIFNPPNETLIDLRNR